MRIVLMGAPGCGKRTQAQLLADKYHVPYIDLQDLVDAAVAEETDLGKQIKACVARREPVPNDLVVKVMQQRLKEADARRGFILNSFPRNIPQAQELDNRLSWFGRPLQIALMMQVDAAVLMRRSRLRSQSTIRDRLDTYETQIKPVVTYYRAQQKLRTVIGAGSVDEVFRKICDIIDTDIRPLTVNVLDIRVPRQAVVPAKAAATSARGTAKLSVPKPGSARGTGGSKAAKKKTKAAPKKKATAKKSAKKKPLKKKGKKKVAKSATSKVRKKKKKVSKKASRPVTKTAKKTHTKASGRKRSKVSKVRRQAGKKKAPRRRR